MCPLDGGGVSSEVFLDIGELYVPQVVVDDNDEPETPAVNQRNRPARSNWINGKFLRPRVPLDWLSPACNLSGKALATALAIWYLSGLRKGRTEELKLTTTTLKIFNVDRYAKSRALKELERAGLISVRREGRKNPVVTILEVSGGNETAAP